MSPYSRPRTAGSAQRGGACGAPALASRDFIDCLHWPACQASDGSLIAPVACRRLVHAQRHACKVAVVIDGLNRLGERGCVGTTRSGASAANRGRASGEPASASALPSRAAGRGWTRCGPVAGRARADSPVRQSRVAHRTRRSGASVSWRRARRRAWLERRGRSSGIPSHAGSSAVRRRVASAPCEAAYGILPSYRIRGSAP